MFRGNLFLTYVNGYGKIYKILGFYALLGADLV